MGAIICLAYIESVGRISYYFFFLSPLLNVGIKSPKKVIILWSVIHPKFYEKQFEKSYWNLKVFI